MTCFLSVYMSMFMMLGGAPVDLPRQTYGFIRMSENLDDLKTDQFQDNVFRGLIYFEACVDK